MYCLKCGKELPEGAQFCPHCGTSVSSPAVPSQSPEPDVRDMPSPEPPDTPPEPPITSPEPQSSTPPEPQSDTPPVSDEEVKCPRCGAGGCTPQYKQNVSGGGYGCCSGGLGALILGPLGLLCGACGRSTKTTNTLVWICPKCGHEFQVVDKARVYGNLLGLILCAEEMVPGLSILLNFNDSGFFLMGLLICACCVIGIIAAIPAIPKDPLSYLTYEQEDKLKKFAIIVGAISVVMALFILIVS